MPIKQRQGVYGRARKRDANEDEIVAALELGGASVVRLDKPTDLLVGFAGVTHVLEVKNPNGKNRIEPDQAEFIEAWRGSPVHIVRTPEEALQAIGLGGSSLAVARVSRVS